MNLLLALALLVPAFAEGPKEAKTAAAVSVAPVKTTHNAPTLSLPRATIPTGVDGARLAAGGVQTTAGVTGAAEVAAASPSAGTADASPANITASKLSPHVSAAPSGSTKDQAAETSIDQAKAAAARAKNGSTDFSAEFDHAGRRTGDTSSYPQTRPVGESVDRSGAATLAPADKTAPASGERAELPAPAAAKPQPGRWEKWTQRLTDWAAAPFVALQAPQIWQNFLNLSAGAAAMLSNLPWMGYSTGILGNMLLLAYFVSIKEKSAARVQGIGVATSAVVVAQIYMASVADKAAAAWHMPGWAFAGMSVFIVGGLSLSLLKYFDKVKDGLWGGWTKLTGLLGVVVLPQVLWTTFVPQTPSVIPAVAAAVVGLAATILDVRGSLKGLPKKLWDTIGATTATFLFMYGPIAQLMSNYAKPDGMAGISVLTLLLAMLGNGLMLPAAMRVLMKDKSQWQWFVGSLWGVALGGLAVLWQMALVGMVALAVPLALSVAIPAYLLSAYALNRRS